VKTPSTPCKKPRGTIFTAPLARLSHSLQFLYPFIPVLNDAFLDPVELAVLKDREFMPVKQRVTHKLDQWLTQLGRALQAEVAQVSTGLPPAVHASSPKLSRGENYHSYAYRLVDSPRVFGGEDMFVFRSLVLWGHAVGYHLMLAGRYREDYLSLLTQAIPELPAGYFLSAQDHPWRWEHETDGLIPAHHLSAETCGEILAQRSFVKISYFLPIEDSQELEATGLAIWRHWQQVFAQAQPGS
jgi:hypothetical protein